MVEKKRNHSGGKQWFSSDRIDEMIEEQKKSGNTLLTVKYKGHRYVWVGIYNSRFIGAVARRISGHGFHVIKRDGELFARRI
jgi:hypothetical protein